MTKVTEEVLFAEIVEAVDPWGGKFRLNEAYRPIAEALVKKYPEINHVPINNMIFIENAVTAPKRKGLCVLAQIGTVPGKWSEIIEQLTGARVWYFMEIFKKHVKDLSQEQIVALVYHELRHISPLGGTVGHDIEDWANMVHALGPQWNCSGVSIPDLLGDDVNWDTITGMRRSLFDEPVNGVVSEAADSALMTISAAGRSVTVDMETLRKAAGGVNL